MKIEHYNSQCALTYKNTISYPEHNTYYGGSRIKVHVPIETPLNKVMIVGAYPSARFRTVEGPMGKITDTPVEDHDSPFSNETYMDGVRARTILSGQELNEVILQRIGVKREDCWITDLVKVFLFKPGHIDRYRKLGKNDVEPNRHKFMEYARTSLPFLHEEIEICNPYVIILLGLEVVQAVFNISAARALIYLDGAVRKLQVKGIERNFICLPHPGILMKKMDQNKWPERFEREIAPRVYNVIENIKNIPV
jgi:uracil-DNA glycosylase family 4